ncbi:MAG: 30S ribosomal protein S4 [Candidatus Yonathbacteria bacterium]|nr:30S ribosomal protein S4 [Candidatus Yonathbacteria bacterium]
MSRITCKICRRLGETICGREKCAFKKRSYPPGKLISEKKHRSPQTDYGRQLREKQKVRYTYGVSEKQFSNYVKEASAKRGINPAEYLFEALESRLDNAVYRAGFSSSRALARQMVSHGHILVNGRRTDIASRRLKAGDILSVRAGSAGSKLFEGLAEKLKTLTVPTWLKLDTDKNTATFQGKPKTGQVESSFNLTSVVEFYSR